jgi:hypothetical protein
VKDDPFRVEFAENGIGRDRLRARGVAVGSGPVRDRLDYELETVADSVTSRLRVTSRGEAWCRDLDLRRGADGVWSITADEEGRLDEPPAGGDPAALTGALDCDLELSPVTNHDADPAARLAGWRRPDPRSPSVDADGQRYRFVRSAADHRLVRFEATDGGFAADITIDADAVVIEYPGIARRLGAAADPSTASAEPES